MNGIKLKVNEIFYSVQGEGANAGMAAVFVRLAGCNLNCPFCDTRHESYSEMTIIEIKAEIERYHCPNVIWTGGEPTLQLSDEILIHFREYYNCMETNGTNKVPERINYVTCSPKVSIDRLHETFNGTRWSGEYGYCLDEFRFPVKKGDMIPKINQLPDARYYCISPIDVSKANIDYCLTLIKENPQWKLSVQIHKLLNIR